MRIIPFILLLLAFPLNAQFVATSGGGPSTQGDASGWVSPTSKEDDQWTDGALIYDGDLGTFGYESTNGQSVTLLTDAVKCSKVRIYAGRAAGGAADLKVEVYYSAAFHTLHDGTLTEDTWVEIAVGSTESITKAKISAGDGIESQVMEFEFYKVGLKLLSGQRRVLLKPKFLRVMELKVRLWNLNFIWAECAYLRGKGTHLR